jgi:Na+-driven multidrug efflux pump
MAFAMLAGIGASADILPYAKQFAFVIILGLTFQSVSMGLNNIIRAEGNPKTAMVTMLYFLRGKSYLKLKKENMYLKLGIIKQIVAIGMSAFVMQLAASVVTVTFNNALAEYGGSNLYCFSWN